MAFDVEHGVIFHCFVGCSSSISLQQRQSFHSRGLHERKRATAAPQLGSAGAGSSGGILSLWILSALTAVNSHLGPEAFGTGRQALWPQMEIINSQDRNKKGSASLSDGPGSKSVSVPVFLGLNLND